jgi:AraC-like DNA-binding protein
MMQIRQLAYRPSPTPGVLSPLTVRSTGRYRFKSHLEDNKPRGFTQLFWVNRGRLHYFRSGETHQAGPGETFFYTGGEAHWVEVADEACDYYWVTFDGNLIGHWLTGEFPSPCPRKVGSCPVNLFNELKTIIPLPTIQAEREAAALGLRLLMQFTGSIPSSLIAGNSRDGDFCQKLEQIIQEQFPNPEFGIQEAARQMELHRTSLFRLYRQQRGINPSAHLQRMRLRHGLELLRNSRMSISEIALASGFRDANYFSKKVRQATGESPRQIQRQDQAPKSALSSRGRSPSPALTPPDVRFTYHGGSGS